ncbi:MAG: hypothetical protein ACRD2F_12125, partial [Terriglobales bacterium]
MAAGFSLPHVEAWPMPHGRLNRLLKKSDSLGARAAGPPAASQHTCASHQYCGPYAAFFGRGRAGSPRSRP